MNFVTESVRIAELLEQSTLTQGDLARQIGVSRSNVSNWLRGRHRPGHDQLRKIAEVFGTTVSYLRGDSNQRYAVEAAETVPLTTHPAEDVCQMALTELQTWLGVVDHEENCSTCAEGPCDVRSSLIEQATYETRQILDRAIAVA